MAVLVGCTASDPAPASDRPNILMISLDDLNWNSVGVMGNPMPGLTPNIDSFAAEGVLFRRGYVTIAICHPSRNVWMSGLYPHNSGAMGFEPLADSIPTMLDVLNRAGYFTAVLAKEGHSLPERLEQWGDVITEGELGRGRASGLYARNVRRLMETATDAGQPFFLMVNIVDPHRPFPEAADRGSLRTSVGRLLHRGQYPPVTPIAYEADDVWVPGFLPDLPDIREELTQYYTAVNRADQTVGAVLRELDTAGHRDDTFVILMSDNGMSFPFSKTNVWDASTRTPWIVRWPGVTTAGQVDDQHFVSGIDVAPTLLDVAEASPLATDGASIVPLLRGESVPDRDLVYTEMGITSGGDEYPMRSVTTHRFGYIFNPWADGTREFINESQAGLTWPAMVAAADAAEAIAERVHLFSFRVVEELYDYAADPHALRNLAADAQHAADLDEMRRLMIRTMERTRDPLLGTYSAFLERQLSPCSSSADCR